MSDVGVHPSGSFTGLRAIVTGGASGIGLATARLLASQGAKVACLDVDPAGLSEQPYDLLPVTCDVSDPQSVAAAISQVGEALGGIDIVVNNAGIGAQGTVEDNDDTEWHRVFDVNVLGIVRVTREALPWLRVSDHAAVVDTCSIVAWAGFPNPALSGASKGAV